MAAKGSILKKEIADKILETFPNSFLYNNNKEIRINGTENGESLQIKITFTTAKTKVENENLSTKEIPLPSSNDDLSISNEMENFPQEPTEEEKERLTFLLNKLGL